MKKLKLMTILGTRPEIIKNVGDHQEVRSLF